MFYCTKNLEQMIFAYNFPVYLLNSDDDKDNFRMYFPIDDNSFCFLWTSQSTTCGHPDKLCDFISDSVLDACLNQDPNSKVGCECVLKDQICMVFGQITTKADIIIESIARKAIKQAGYDSVQKGMDYRCEVLIISIDKQSSDIAQSVHEQKGELEMGAGDQGLMIGYATDQTEQLMPCSQNFCNLIVRKLEETRKLNIVSWIRPYAKVQVTIKYQKSGNLIKPIGIERIVIQCQSDKNTSLNIVKDFLQIKIIHEVISSQWLENTKIIINPQGIFSVPPQMIGLTGRKLIADTYGGWGGHGGGAFSGKDSSKVDRSAGYAARWIAKSLVANHFCKRAQVQISYSIGISQPLSVFVDSFQTVASEYTDQDLTSIVYRNFDLRPGALIRQLELKRPIFKQTSHGGHFGRKDSYFKWEIPKNLSHQMKNICNNRSRTKKDIQPTQTSNQPI